MKMILRKLSFGNFGHKFHIVNPSPWPFLVAINLFILIFGIIKALHGYTDWKLNSPLGLILCSISACCRWRDIVREATYEGFHTRIVQEGLRYGMKLFILSEIMFFISFFWAFFHSSLAPAIELGGIWPPRQIHPINPWGLPTVNTALSILSGVFVTVYHKHLRLDNPRKIARYYVLKPFLYNKKRRSKLFRVKFMYTRIIWRKGEYIYKYKLREYSGYKSKRRRRKFRTLFFRFFKSRMLRKLIQTSLFRHIRRGFRRKLLAAISCSTDSRRQVFARVNTRMLIVIKIRKRLKRNFRRMFRKHRKYVSHDSHQQKRILERFREISFSHLKIFKSLQSSYLLSRSFFPYTFGMRSNPFSLFYTSFNILFYGFANPLFGKSLRKIFGHVERRIPWQRNRLESIIKHYQILPASHAERIRRSDILLNSFSMSLKRRRGHLIAPGILNCSWSFRSASPFFTGISSRDSKEKQIYLSKFYFSILALCTLLCGFLFLIFQLIEYSFATFTISDGVFGSIFYMATGFHGIHVLIGLIFLSICFYRHLVLNEFTTKHHLGLELAIWYWHFVDVVWICLYACIYHWGS